MNNISIAFLYYGVMLYFKDFLYFIEFFHSVHSLPLCTGELTFYQIFEKVRWAWQELNF